MSQKLAASESNKLRVIWNSKRKGDTVTVTIREGSITTQKADAEARSYFKGEHKAVRLTNKETVGTLEIRTYQAA